MPSWLHHPRYVPVRDALVTRLRSPSYRFRRLDHVVFLCGMNRSTARDRVRDYLQRRHSEYLVFYAEAVWPQIAGRSELDALQMEELLAALADIVVVIVESPGTFAELGAFSISPPLREKLLPILHTGFKGSGSFIESGPVAWVDVTSRFRPSIWADHSKILTSIDQIVERLQRIPKSKRTKVKDLRESAKHRLFFLCDLVSVIQPAPEDIICHYLAEIVGPDTIREVGSLLGLACVMNLVRSETAIVDGNEEKVYFRGPGEEHLDRPYHHARLLDLPSERASHVSVLQLIPDARAALERVARC